MGMYKVEENGVIRDMTPDEIAALTAQEPTPEEHTISDEERISALEAQLASYEAAYTEGVNEA